MESHLQAQSPSLSPNDTVIIFDIKGKDYHFHVFISGWQSYLAAIICPACGARDCLKKHARYTKHYYLKQIGILRLKCENCATTHALIPSFSLPGTSGGTDEAETYLKKRSSGVGRGTAGRFLSELGVSEKYGSQLEKMFINSVDQAKAVFPEAGNPELNGMEWVNSVVSDPSRPLYSLNCFCLERMVNAVCFCRASILRFRACKSGEAISHHLGTSQTEPQRIHSP